jgi:NRAMP (natural resistance-associated macrophage protein)-like metal ion transporter
MKLKEYWKILGPGLTTGAADDDPSGIATYSQMGASSGFGLIWLAPLLYPLMSVVQEMCARIGLASGVGLATNIKRYYSKKILVGATLLLLGANILNIGANLGAMADSTRLIFPQINFAVLVAGFALFSLVLQIFIPYKEYAKYLKYLALVLVAYILSALFVEINWRDVIYHAFVPAFSFSRETIILICAAFGTTISPYLFFWQTDQEVEEQILKGETHEEERRTYTTDEDIKKMRIDVWSGMFLSNLVMFFIIAASAAVLNKNGVTDVATASQAAEALRPFAGDFAYLLFTLGIVGTGLLSIPVLAGSASYAVSELFGWKVGLFQKLSQASAFYTVIILSVLLGIVLNFTGLDPMKGLIYSAVLNGIVAPVILFLIVGISSDEHVMGIRKNRPISKFFGWLTVILMSLVGLTAIIFLLV